MTIIGIILLIIGGGAAGMMFTGVGGDLLPLLNKMPLGFVGWAIMGVLGLLLAVLTRRAGD